MSSKQCAASDSNGKTTRMSDGCENKTLAWESFGQYQFNKRTKMLEKYKCYTVKHLKQPEARPGSREGKIKETALRTAVIKSIIIQHELLVAM